MKILVLSNTPWNTSNSFGATYTALFKELTESGEAEIANIYCNRGRPDGSVDGKYLQITEKTILKNRFWKKYPQAIRVEPVTESGAGEKKSAAYEFMRKTRLQLFYWGRDIIWLSARRKNREMTEFIEEFQPDVLFFPLYSLYHTNRLARKIKKLTGKPMVMYVSDDNYSLKQRSWSPLFWIDRFMKRRSIRKTVKMCDLLYTACDAQKEEYAEALCVPCKVLHKPALWEVEEKNFDENEFGNFMIEEEAPESDRKVYLYAGNIGNGRWKTLAAMGLALKKLPFKAELRIYTDTPISGRMRREFKKGKIYLRAAVSPQRLEQLRDSADVLVFAEPFGGKGAALSRLSLSTKLPEYLASGKPILAAGSEKIASIKYLADNDAATVITSAKDAEIMTAEFNVALFDDPEKKQGIITKVENATNCIKRDFSKEVIQKELITDLQKRHAKAEGKDGETYEKYLHINAVFGEKTGSTGALTAGYCDVLAEVADNYVISAEKGLFYRAEQKVHALLSRITGYQARFSPFETRKILKKIDRVKPDRIYLGNLHSNFINEKKLLSYTAEKKIPVYIILHDCWFLTGKCNYNKLHNCHGAPCRKGIGKCPAMKKDIPSWFFDRTKKQFSERKALLQKQSKIVFVGVTDTVTERARHIYGDLINADFETQYNWFNENVFRPELFIGERDDIRWKLGASIGFNAMRGNLVVSAAEYWSLSKGLKRLNRLGELLGYSYAVILAGKKPKLRDLPKGWQAFDNVFFVGELDQEKLRELFLAADIVVSASKAETFGLTLAEAMACGTPAVACDGFGAEEVAGVLYNEIFGKELPEIDGDLPVLADIIGEYCALPRNETEDVCLNTARKYFSKQAAKEKLNKE